MEKLQAAIEKARGQRENRAPERREPANEPPAPASEAWSALTRIEPRARTLARNRLFNDAQSREAAHFDMLRTKVLQQCRENGWRRIAVTSPTKACGKTTTCCNLAFSFNRLADRRMMLLDFDMRRPEMAKLLGQSGDKGLRAVLEGEARFADEGRRLGDNVAIAMNYSPAPNPSKVIQKDSTGEVVEELDRIYRPDLIIFDTPPMLATDDTMAMLRFVDCALIVVAAEATTTEQLDICEKELAEQTNVLGVVLNKCHYATDRYGYDYSY